MPELVSRMEGVRTAARLYGQRSTELALLPFWEMCLFLMEDDWTDVGRMTGRVMDDKTLDEIGEHLENGYRWYHSQLLEVHFLFGDFRLAEEMGEKCEALLFSSFEASGVSTILTFSGLVAVARARASTRGRRRRIKKAQRYLNKLAVWAAHSPFNFLPKKLILEAELLSLKGDLAAYATYVSATATLENFGFLMLLAVAQELTAKHLLRVGNDEQAHLHASEALRQYERWGSPCKVKHLRKELANRLDFGK